MFIAHLGVGLAAKKICPRVPLGVLLVSGQAVDVLCGLLMVSGIERMRVSPGISRMSPLEFVSYPWSHSLVMNLVWAALAAAIGMWLYRDRLAASVIAALVFSHWVLDWISHIPDMPLSFEGSPKVGLGLWNSPAGTIIAELALFAGGAILYLGSTRSRDRVGPWAVASLLVFFPVLFFLNHFGPPPPTHVPQQLLALPILVFALLLPWGNWIEKHRGPASP
jgi:hypothetical protein